MKSLLLVQIDGLASSYFDTAIVQNRMPFTKKLLKKGWIKREFFCGIPSTTPASQMRLFYGLDDIVGFRFFIKNKNIMFNPTNTAVMRFIEDNVCSKQQRPLLREGATVMSQFTGGSSRSMSFTKFIKDKWVIIALLSYLRNPFQVFFYFLRVIVMIAIDKLENRHDPYVKSRKHTSLVVHLIKRIFSEFSQGEIATFLTRKLIKSNESLIYVNYAGYDTLAHYYGPDSVYSLNYLSMVDIYIKNLYIQIQKKDKEYEIIILSDHGQTYSQSYRKYTGSSLGDLVAKLFPDKMIIEHAESMNSPVFSNTDLYLLDSGGLSLAYASKIKGHLTQSQLELHFPDFACKVSQLPGIEFVLTWDHDRPMYTKNGTTYVLTEKQCEKLFWFSSETEQKLIYGQMIKLLKAPFAADAYLFGKVLGKEEIVGFEDQIGTHGSIGGSQTSSFMLSRDFAFDEKKVKSFSDLYKLLNSYIYDQADKNGQNHLRAFPNS